MRWCHRPDSCTTGRRSSEGWKVSDEEAEDPLEEENRRLKEMVADLSLDKAALTTVIRKNGCFERPAEVALVMASMRSPSALLASSWKWTARHTDTHRERTGTHSCAKRC